MKTKKVLLFILFDIISISLSFMIALNLSYHVNEASRYIQFYLTNVIAVTLIRLFIFYIFNLYKTLWEYASIDELVEVFFGTIVGSICVWTYLTLINQPLPIRMFIIISIVELGLVGGSRLVYRVLRRYRKRLRFDSVGKRVLIVGAGSSGVMILKELRNHDNLNAIPVAFIDDDKKKRGSVINGISVVGGRDDIAWAVNKFKVDEIIIAMPSAKQKDKKIILNKCTETKVKTKTLPGMFELIHGDVSVNNIRDVQIEDLLGREEVKLNIYELSNFIQGKVIMVTGGGGSIGSELCRQIAEFNPKELIILDIYENNIYDLQQELIRNYKKLEFKAIIASVRDRANIDEIMEEYKPNIIFHAAAHKHVPFMESNPKVAIKNNVLGTLNMVQAANKFAVDKFILISTDKAVNPTNVMGATKRLAEMIIQTYNSISKTDYVAVRFGNVLGSNGSVIPLFKKQIAEGGPVTVTDERIIRFFMTIPEACNLVLEAGTMATGGEIFVLDMGEPVKIIDLAKNLIRLSGFEPEIDIPIKITGLRPGEKLYEEILIRNIDMCKTKNDKIYIEEPMEFNYDMIMLNINRLKKSIENDSVMDIKYNLAKIIPSYIPYVEKSNKIIDFSIDEDVVELENLAFLDNV